MTKHEVQLIADEGIFKGLSKRITRPLGVTFRPSAHS